MHPVIKNFREIKDIKPLLTVSIGHAATHWVNGIFLVSLPFIVKDLGLNFKTAGTMVSIFFMAAVAITIISGPIIDITREYIKFQFMCLISGILALIILGFSDTVYLLAIAAVFIGFCVSGWHTPAIPYLSQIYHKNRGLALSIHTVGASLGDAIGPPIAGILMLFLAWEATSMLLSIPVIVMAVYLIIYLEPSEKVINRMELTSEHEVIEKKPTTRVNYVEGLKALVGNRSMLQLCLMAGVWSMTQNGVTVFLPLYLYFIMDASPALIGFALFSIQIGAIFAGPMAGAWSDQIGARKVVLCALVASTLLLLILPFFNNVYIFIGIVSLAGCSLYSIRPVIHSWTMDLTTDKTSGSAVSMLFTAQAALTGTVPFIGGILADNYGLKVTFYMLTLTSLIALTVAFLMPRVNSKVR
ncbi:MAG: MFS transporter [Rhodobiaceae bacterium]|jgi:MFS family permease|nr:MFS transporter [Rhodobiaceae bacterium]